MLEELRNELSNLANARRVEKNAKKALEEMIDEVKQSDEYKKLESLRDHAQENKKAATTQINVLSLNYFDKEKVKKFLAVGIQERTKLLIANNEIVIREWVEKNMPILLEVNDKKLLNLAKDNKSIPESIVARKKYLKVTIGTDLSDYETESK